MKDKFIMIDLNDERSKKISEILGNKTSKKIIDFLTNTKEASEKDISDKLKIPLNTVEYNLKKLLKVGLVEKTKNFFWSKKGKKISMYKIVNKHIIISPKSKKPNLNFLNTVLPVIIAVILLVGIIALFPLSKNKTNPADISSIKQFSSKSELKTFLEKNMVQGNRGGIFEDAFNSMKASTSGAAESVQKATDYSETNIQVLGVDEADIIKNDGKYIYAVSKNKVLIINAYPAENMEILSEIKFENENVGEIYINEDKIIIFTGEYSYADESITRCLSIGCVIPSQEQKANTYIYDTSNKENPKLQNKISTTGSYVDSRMIENYVYVIANQYAYKDSPMPYIEEDGVGQTIKPEQISYLDAKDNYFQYTIILGINIDNGKSSEEVMLTGASYNIFVSSDNIYTTYTRYPIWYGEDETKSQEKTYISKISIDKDEIKFAATGEVPGYILNQFSMDEFEDNFRIATTIRGYSNNVDTSTNNLYVLDKELNIIGNLEGVAPGESIYSVRFMGNRAYMVTFRHIDPLFVIDLKEPENPVVLGKLKIPGYSDYLHPYDETHLIGIGKEVDASIDADKIHTQGAVYYTAIQGVKLAIFDVSDVENPIEMYKEVIGDRGTESLAASDHKAFLFDKERELLVIPITVAELKEGQSKNQQGEYTFQGAYVYNINLKNGFDLKGKISHYDKDDDTFKKSGYYWRGDKDIKRSLYMDDVLYTFSSDLVKANDLDNLDEINSVVI